MDAAVLIRAARDSAGLTQSDLAERSGTSQPALSAYESGARIPEADTLARILAATGERLASVPAERAVRTPGRATLAGRGRTLAQVIGLAEALPSRRARRLAYPRLRGAE